MMLLLLFRRFLVCPTRSAGGAGAIRMGRARDCATFALRVARVLGILTGVVCSVGDAFLAAV